MHLSRRQNRSVPTLPAVRDTDVEPAPPDPPGPESAFFAGCAGRDALEADPPALTDAISWLSAHVAALDRVVRPVATETLTAHGTLLGEQAVAAHRLEHTLRQLHRRISGDGAVAHLDPAELRAAVLTALDVHAALQQRIAAELYSALPADQWGQLVGRYTASVLRAPTRPHPHIPHRGVVGRLAARLATAGDRFLDMVDSRPVHAVAIDYACAPGPSAATI